MRRLKVKKSNRQVSRARILGISCVFAVLIGCCVFLAAFLLRGNNGYAEAYNIVNDILVTKDAVRDGMKLSVSSLDLSDEDEITIGEMRDSIEKAGMYMESLSASFALKDSAVAQKYEEVRTAFDSLKTFSETYDAIEIVRDELNNNGSLSSNVLDELVESDNAFLQGMGRDLRDYEDEAAEFVQKYNSSANNNESELIEEYSLVIADGESLRDKYADVSLQDICGVSLDEMMSFYDRVNELKEILVAKK